MRIKRSQSKRRGIAATEAAVCLPLIVVFTFGTIETTNALYLRESLSLGAYEAAKVISSSSGEASVAEDRCDEFLTARGVTSYEMTITPDGDVNVGEIITVTATAPASAYQVGPTFFLGNTTVVAEVSMVKTP